MAILVEEVEAIVIIEKHLLEDPVDRMCIFLIILFKSSNLL